VIEVVLRTKYLGAYLERRKDERALGWRKPHENARNDPVFDILIKSLFQLQY
jgi:hypothetical protein